MKILILILALSFGGHLASAAGGTFSRDPASAADDLASESVADDQPSDYQSATSVITKNLKPFQACFNAEVAKHPGLAGHVVVSWRITASGDATEVRLVKSDIKSNLFDSCLRTELGKLKFAPPSPKTAQPFTYPFEFFSENNKRQY